MEEHTNYLAHHGVKGQRWGVRRYQNPDGSLTAEGKSRLSKYKEKEGKKYDKVINRITYSRMRYTNPAKYKKLLSDYQTRQKAVFNMSYDDMRLEKKRRRGAAFVGAVVLGGPGAGVGLAIAESKIQKERLERGSKR